MEEYAGVILEHAQSLLHNLKVYEVKMLAYIARNKLAEVTQTALPILTLLAVRFPREPNQADVEVALQEIETALAGRAAEALLELPPMTDPHRLAAMRILSILSSTTYFIEPNLLPLIVFKQVTLSIKHGNAPESALAYANYALILCGYIGNTETGYQFGRLALKLAEKLNMQKLAAKTLFTVNAFVYHWKEPLHGCLGSLLEAYRQALETGDLEYAVRSVFVYNAYAYFAGKTLTDLLQEMNNHTEAISQLKQTQTPQLAELYEQAIQTLTGQFDYTEYISKEIYEQEKMLSGQVAEQDKSLIFHLYLNKLILSYLWHDYETAIEYAAIARTYTASVAAMLVIPVCCFYDGLAHLALLREKQPEAATSSQDKIDQADVLKQVADCRRKLKSWADSAPMNHRHRYCLVEAEYARILGQDGAAREYYDKAIVLAQDNQFTNEAALASELAADFYLAKEQLEIAQVYLQKAHYGYRQWGALCKVDDLETRYRQLLSTGRPSQVERKTTVPTTSGTYTASSAIGALDLTSVIKASQIISGEIMLDALLSKMMTIVIENAGAQKGYLILEKNRVWSIEASGAASQDDVVVLQAIPLSIAAEGRRPIVPGSVINYVIRSYQTIVLNDAANERQFGHDPYIANTQPKSIMCAPLLTQGKLIGVLYLENNLTTEAFTPDRLEVLNLLSAQAAISIENARFYAHQIELTKAYSRFVPREILHFLNKQSIIDVQLGDQIQQDMTVLFSDIRSFTHLSEQMTPQENFNFINAYLRRVSPIIRKYNGFIDKYMGDAIMALFPSQPNDAMQAAIAMQQTVAQYNIERANSGYSAISIGIGLHTGRVMLGTIGEEARMEGTVISDAVNLAARLEGLSKIYGAPIIISGDLIFNLDNPAHYKFRFLDKVKVKGKEEAVSIFEILEGQPEEVVALKLQAQDNFERGLLHYHSQEFAEARERFQAALAINPNDMAIQLYLRRVEHYISYGVPVDWEGVEALTEK
jgi:class 3 adenylate cyclase